MLLLITSMRSRSAVSPLALICRERAILMVISFDRLGSNRLFRVDHRLQAGEVAAYILGQGLVAEAGFGEADHLGFEVHVVAVGARGGIGVAGRAGRERAGRAIDGSGAGRGLVLD